MVTPQPRDGDTPRDPHDRAPDDLGLEQLGAVRDEQGISLEELSRAYAQLIGAGDDPYERPPPAEPDIPSVVAGAEVETAADEACELCPRSILEAILFVGHPRNEPLRSEHIAALMRGVTAREIDQLVDELNQDYERQGHPYRIVSAEAGYRLELRPQFAALRNVFYGRVRQARLSQAAIDVLAIVAYQQGLTREEIDRLRGRPSGALLSQLVRRQLLRIERPDTKPRRPRYHTTDRFLRLFGLSGLEELPQSHTVDQP